MDRIVREAECKQITGLGRTTRWELERAGQFPARRRLSGNAVGWLESELTNWLLTRRAGTSVAPVRAIAARLLGPRRGRSRFRNARASGPSR